MMRKNFASGVLLIMFLISGFAVLIVSLYSRSLAGYLVDEMEYNIESRLIEVSKNGASLVTADELERFREIGDMNLPEYQALRELLRDFSIDSDVLYVYYLRVENGMLRYIVDNDFDEATRVGLDTPSANVTLAPGLASAAEGRAECSGLGNYMTNWKGLLSAYAPIRDKDGRVAAVCGVDINDEMILAARDRTRLLWALELATVVVVFASGFFCLVGYRRETKIARESNITKSKFMSKVSHEMKTPLAVISVKAQFASALLKRGGDLSEVRESLDNMRDEADRLARMSDAMIALEIAGSSFNEIGDLDAGYLLREIAAIYRTLVEHDGNRLSTDIPDDMPRISGNADEISQVLINLISNANKHTKNGDISVAAAWSGETMTVTVADNGEGVQPETLPEIFERRPLRAPDGKVNGMGLSICRDIVTSHGGRIWMENSPGVGTAVRFTLPVRGRDES